MARPFYTTGSVLVRDPKLTESVAGVLLDALVEGEDRAGDPYRYWDPAVAVTRTDGGALVEVDLYLMATCEDIARAAWSGVVARASIVTGIDMKTRRLSASVRAESAKSLGGAR